VASIRDLTSHLTPELQKKRQEMLEQRQLPNLGFYDQLMVYPELFERLSELGSFVRFHSSLSDPVREATILMTGVELKSELEWSTHQEPAMRAGLSPELLHRIGSGSALDPEHERLRQLVRTVTAQQSVPQALFDELVEAYTLQGAVELVTLVSMYRMFAALGAAFDSVMPGGSAPPWS
jgi:alkylhydroperoxidase family enzyme